MQVNSQQRASNLAIPSQCHSERTGPQRFGVPKERLALWGGFGGGERRICFCYFRGHNLLRYRRGRRELAKTALRFHIKLRVSFCVNGAPNVLGKASLFGAGSGVSGVFFSAANLRLYRIKSQNDLHGIIQADASRLAGALVPGSIGSRVDAQRANQCLHISPLASRAKTRRCSTLRRKGYTVVARRWSSGDVPATLI